MARPSALVPLACLTALLSLSGCLKVDEAGETEANADPNQADANANAEADANADANANAEAEGKAAAEPAADSPTPDPDAAAKNALTPEEERLIAADPDTLSADENRKRAHALRKKIMQNPDSPAAKELEEVRAAVLAGEIDPSGQVPGKKGDQLTLTAPHVEEKPVEEKPADGAAPE